VSTQQQREARPLACRLVTQCLGKQLGPSSLSGEGKIGPSYVCGWQGVWAGRQVGHSKPLGGPTVIGGQWQQSSSIAGCVATCRCPVSFMLSCWASRADLRTTPCQDYLPAREGWPVLLLGMRILDLGWGGACQGVQEASARGGQYRWLGLPTCRGMQGRVDSSQCSCKGDAAL